MKKGMQFLLKHNSGALFYDPGLGKTSTTLGALKVLKKKKMTNKVLIIAPLRVCYSVWPREIKKWTDFKGFTYEILHGPKKDAALKRDADIYLINPEGLEWLLQATKTKVTSAKTGKTKVKLDINIKKFKALGFDILVIDELTKFKHHGSARFKLLSEVAHTFRVKWGLTGSPAANGLIGLFGQCKILDGGRSLGKFITQYRSKYFETVDHGGFVWMPKAGAEEQIYERISPLALRAAAEDYLEMPKLIINKIKLEMPPSARSVYDRMEGDLFAAINSKTITAANAAVASGKCRQIASGGIYLDPELCEMGFKPSKASREWAHIHDCKVDALEDLVEELQGSPLLVAYDFNHDLERIRARFGKDVPYIGTGVSAKKCEAIEDAWNKGELPLLFGHPQSMGHGLNLQASCNHVAMFTMPWDFELYDQFIRRVLRSGNEFDRVFLHLLMMEDSIDELVYYSLVRKDKTQQSFFKALLELAKRRKK